MRDEEVRRAHTEAIKEAQRKRSRMLNARGNNCDYSLTNHDGMPESMANVACVAIADGGYVAVMDDGTCEHDGLSTDFLEVLQRQKFSNITYIALGRRVSTLSPRRTSEDSTTDRKNLKSSLRTHAAASSTSHSKPGMPIMWPLRTARRSGATDVLMAQQDVNSVWLGVPAYRGADVPYLVSYGRGGNYESDLLPDEVVEWIDESLAPRRCLKQFLASGEDFFVRYS